MARVTLQGYCAEARQLIDERAFDEAIAICHHILERYPKHIKTYQILGEACLERGELKAAADIFKRLLEQADPENFVAYAGLGVISEERGQFDEAIWYMERAFELIPNRDEIRNALRRLYGKRDGSEPTRIKLNKAALARLYARGGQYRQAIEEFRTLLSLEPNRDRMDLKLSLAETLWRDGRREQAAELAREILQTCPSCLKAMLLQGVIELEKGQKDEGWAILDETRSLDPENTVAQALLGEQSPLPAKVVKVPRMEREAKTVPAEAIAELAQEVPVEEHEAAEPVAAEVREPEALLKEESTPEAVAEEAALQEGLEEQLKPADVFEPEAWLEQEITLEAVAEEKAPEEALEEQLTPADVFEPEAWLEEEITPEAVAEEAALEEAPEEEAAPAGIFEPEAWLEEEITSEAVAEEAALEEAPEEEVAFAEIVEPEALEEEAIIVEAMAEEVSLEEALEEEPAFAEIVEPEALEEEAIIVEAVAEETPEEAPEQEVLPAELPEPEAPAKEAIIVEAVAEEAALEEEVTVEAVTEEQAIVEEAQEEEVALAEILEPEALLEDEVAAEAGTEEAALEGGLEGEATPAEVLEPEALLEEEVTLEAAAEGAALEEELDEETVSVEVAEVEAQAAEEIVSEAVAPAEVITAAPLSDVQRFKRHLEQIPKDNDTRLQLARAYRDQEQMKLALEQYAKLLRSKAHILSQAINDVETIVASRPDNLEAHELLADLYAKNGQLQEAVDRYRWILRRLEAEAE